MRKLFSKKIILFAATITLFSVFIALSYNQVKEVQAQVDPDTPEHQLTCGKEIPNGEAFERTSALSYDLSCAFNDFDAAVNRQIAAARELVRLASQCNVSRCQPVDCGKRTLCTDNVLCRDPITHSCTPSSPFIPLPSPPCAPAPCANGWMCMSVQGTCDSPTLPPCSSGFPPTCGLCTSGGNCNNPTIPSATDPICPPGETMNCKYILYPGGDPPSCDTPTTTPPPSEPPSCPKCEDVCNPPQPCGGEMCPHGQISEQVRIIGEAYETIKRARDVVIGLIDDRTESLCEKINEDIRGPLEKIPCSICVGCPSITRIEAIYRKLNKARAGFDACYVSPADWDDTRSGAKTLKLSLSCADSWSLPRETKSTQGGIPVCTSNFNWFCCY